MMGIFSFSIEDLFFLDRQSKLFVLQRDKFVCFFPPYPNAKRRRTPLKVTKEEVNLRRNMLSENRKICEGKQGGKK